MQSRSQLLTSRPPVSVQCPEAVRPTIVLIPGRAVRNVHEEAPAKSSEARSQRNYFVVRMRKNQQRFW
jgi:hypothetical protein